MSIPSQDRSTPVRPNLHYSSFAGSQHACAAQPSLFFRRSAARLCGYTFSILVALVMFKVQMKTYIFIALSEFSVDAWERSISHFYKTSVTFRDIVGTFNIMSVLTFYLVL